MDRKLYAERSFFMSMKNPYEQHKTNVIMTASKEELTLMLYEGAIKFVNQAIIAIENKDPSKAHDLIVKAENIVMEFRVTLKPEFDISTQLDQLYVYMYDRLFEANIKKDVAMLEEVRDLLRDFRDTWKEAMVIARKENSTKRGK